MYKKQVYFFAVQQTMKKHRFFPLLMLAGLAAALGACSDDAPEIPSDELYVREFIKNYGMPDAGQTWSMATGVETTINVDGISEGTVEVYTAYPGTAGARLAARLPLSGGKVRARIPLLAGSDKVFLQVRDYDKTILSVNSLAITDKQVNANIKVLSDPGNNNLPVVEDLNMTAHLQTATNREWYRRFCEDPANAGITPTYPAVKQWFDANDDFEYTPDPDNPGWVSKAFQQPCLTFQAIPKLKFLNNLYYEMGAQLSYKKTLAPIFDQYEYVDPETGITEKRDGVFKEANNNVERYYHNATDETRLDPNVTFSVGTEGPVTMQCIWRGTQLKDYFGYFYYKEGQEPTSEELWNTIPKYLFLTPDDITSMSNLTQMKMIDSNYSEDESGWGDMTGMSTSNCAYWVDDRMIRGRKYYLAFFGENYDEEASYTFPTGIRIGYFLYKEGNSEEGQKRGEIYFSDCKTEYELTGKAYKEGVEGPNVRPYAAKFRMNNRTYVGFADESGNCDLNDVVFIAQNVIPDPVDITPPEIKEEDPKAMSWTLACEDLGNTDDIDFNDVVLDIEYVAGATTMKITPRAAGGVLVTDIYFREGNSDSHTFLGEIHNMMSNIYSATPADLQPMLNTKRAYHDVDPRSVRSITVAVPADFDFTDPTNGFMARIMVKTRNFDQHYSDAKEEKAYTDVTGFSIPQMLLLPGGWRWPEERVDIARAYPDFKAWVKDGNVTDWTSTGLSGYTLSHRPGCNP